MHLEQCTHNTSIGTAKLLRRAGLVLLALIPFSTSAGASIFPGEAFVALVVGCIYTPGCAAGDVNGDGRVSAADVVAAVQASLPDTTPTPTITPTPSPSASPTPTWTPSPTDTPADTPTEAGTPTTSPTPTETATATQTATPTSTASVTLTPTTTPTDSRTPTLSPTMSATLTASPTRTSTRTLSPSPTRTATPTLTFSPTATPTRTPTASPTITFTPPPTVPQTLAGAAAAAAAIGAGIRDFPLLLADGVAASGCPLGGSATRLCNEFGVPREIIATFDECIVAAPGGSLVIDGTLTLTAVAGSCPNVLLGNVTEAVDLTLIYRDPNEATQRAVSADLTAAVVEHRGLSSACFFTGVTATVSGTIRAVLEGGVGLDVELAAVEVVADVLSATTDCLPIDDTQKLSGMVTFTDTLRTYPVAFDGYDIARSALVGGVEIEQRGTAAGPCFGGESTVTTAAAMAFTPTEACPSAGALVIENAGNPTRTIVYDSGMVSIDADGDGEADDTYPSCASAPACG